MRTTTTSPTLPDDAGESPDEEEGGARLHRRHRPEPPPAPRSWRLRILSRSFNLLVRDRSLDVMRSDDVLAAGQVAAGAELRLWKDLVASVELGYSGGRSSGSVLQDFQTRLAQDALVVGLGLGWRLWDAIMPYVRGGLAATWLVAQVRSDGLSLGGRDTRLGGFVMAGVEVGLPRAWLNVSAFSVSLHVEAGWADLGRFHYGPKQDESGLVEESLAGLGTLRLNGAVLSTGLSVSF